MKRAEHGSPGSIHEARCPRCGYDLRGVVRAWTEACPLRGSCAECGLELVWAEVLCPDKFEPKWCIEFVPEGRRKWLACVKTCVRALRPWRFWNRLNMAFDVRWRRLTVLLIFLLAAVVLSFVTERAVVAISVRRMIGREMFVLAEQAHVAELQSAENLVDVLREDPDATQEELANAEQALADIHWAIEREATDTLPPYWLTVLESVFQPFSTTSHYAWKPEAPWGNYVQPYPPPAWQRSFLHSYGSPVASFGADEWSNMVVWFMVILAAALPIEFVLLPVSRRRSKVRWRHVWRVAAYSTIVLALPWCVAFIGMGLEGLLASLTAPVSPLSAMFIFVPILWLPIWWTAAIDRYLRIPHGWAVVMLFVAITTLAFALVKTVHYLLTVSPNAPL